MCESTGTDMLGIYEIKLDSSYTAAQFQINDSIILSFRRNRNKHGCGEIIFIRKEVISKAPTKFKLLNNNLEHRNIEIIIEYINHYLKKEMIYSFCMSTAKAGECQNVVRGSYSSFSNMVNTYKNIMIIGDLYISTYCGNHKIYHLIDLCKVFDLSELTCTNTCSKSSDHTSVEVILTITIKKFS